MLEGFVTAGPSVVFLDLYPSQRGAVSTDRVGMGAVMQLLRNNYTHDRRTKRSFSYICMGPPGRFEEWGRWRRY